MKCRPQSRPFLTTLRMWIRLDGPHVFWEEAGAGNTEADEWVYSTLPGGRRSPAVYTINCGGVGMAAGAIAPGALVYSVFTSRRATPRRSSARPRARFASAPTRPRPARSCARSRSRRRRSRCWRWSAPRVVFAYPGRIMIWNVRTNRLHLLQRTQAAAHPLLADGRMVAWNTAHTIQGIRLAPAG